LPSEQESTTPSGYTLFYFIFKLLVMNMPIFNFHKMAHMHKGYAYQFSDCIPHKKNWKKEQRTLKARFLDPNQNFYEN
jgi:hypothetical protein